MLRVAATLRTSRRPLARAASGRWTPRATPPAPASKRLDAIGRAIFGTLEGNNERSGNKVLRKKLKGPLLADYYFDQSGQSVDEVGREIVKGWMNDVEAPAGLGLGAGEFLLGAPAWTSTGESHVIDSRR